MATRAPAKKQTAARKSPASQKSPARRTREKDACDLLDADHKAVRKLFDEYQGLSESRARGVQAKKRALAERIGLELTVHMQLEEEIFYPAARGAIKDKPLLNEATVEHATVRELIAQIQGMDDSDELFDAHVQVLGEYIAHHIKEERTEMFPKLRASRLDLRALREEIEQRKQQLMDQMQAPAAAELV